ncbi:MAG: hypothetical protein Q8N47_27935 [Bryobacterales bacterium]|nr:hypothetical protein [Bryobacterales bacterium]
MADMLKDGLTGPLKEPGEAIVVECLPTVMEQIHAEVAEAFYSAPRGGVETGGVLFGAHEGSRVVIFAARPLRCEHASGPSFVLSANDVARLSEMLQTHNRDSGLAGMGVVGWYHSHTRSEIDLTEADLEIHNRFFPEPWQVALVLRPATMRPTRVCFFFREANGGTRSTTFYGEATPPAAPAVPAVPAAIKLPDFLSAPEPPPERRRRWPLWSLLGAVVCLLAVAAAYVTKDYWMAQSPGQFSPSALRLQVTDRQGQLEVRWDASLPFVRDAQSGTLEFLDGSTRRFIMLDSRFLRAGSVTYARQSDTVRVQMTVEKANGSKLEELVSFLGQAPPGSPAPEPEEVWTQAGDPLKDAERVRAESEKQALVQKRLAQLRDEEAAHLAAQKKAPPVPIVPPQPLPRAAPSGTPPAVAGKQLVAVVKPASPPVRPEIPASKPAIAVQQPAPKATPPPPAAQPAPVESKPVPAAKSEPAVSKPVPQVQQPAPQTPAATPPAPQTPAATPPASHPPPAESKPVPVAKSEPAASKPVPLAKPEPAAVKPAAVSAAPVSGEWTLNRSGQSGSPFRPESVTLSISEEGNWVRGTLIGRYRAPKSSGFRPDVSFSFGGQLRSGTMKFPWGAGDGTKGEIEIIRVPNSSDSLEIVWYGADRKLVFNDIVVRAAKR